MDLFPKVAPWLRLLVTANTLWGPRVKPGGQIGTGTRFLMILAMLHTHVEGDYLLISVMQDIPTIA
jgi:hypothetical protein